MNSNRTALNVLAQEGINITEEQMLSETQKTRYNGNGAMAASETPLWDLPSLDAESRITTDLNGGREETATLETAPADEDRADGRAPRIIRALGNVWSFISSALHETYWLLDPDAKCRSVGSQTVGRVDGMESEEHTDYETGRTSYTHYVRYAYKVDDRSHTARKKVGSLANVLKRDALRVYYLPDTYPLKSAIDWNPRAV